MTQLFVSDKYEHRFEISHNFSQPGTFLLNFRLLRLSYAMDIDVYKTYRHVSSTLQVSSVIVGPVQIDCLSVGNERLINKN